MNLTTPFKPGLDTFIPISSSIEIACKVLFGQRILHSNIVITGFYNML